jgi:hypothetical protein
MNEGVPESRHTTHVERPEQSEVTSGIDLRALGIDEAGAARLRAALMAFAEDWDDPAMDIYDDYDAARSARNEPCPSPDCIHGEPQPLYNHHIASSGPSTGVGDEQRSG